MPGSTLHLMFARLLNKKGSTAYFAGSVAYDAVADFHEKDKTHFRKTDDRIHKIIDYVRTLPKSDWNNGIITHLYLDWRWDECELARFIEYHGEGWFKPYRADISRISHHFSNSLPWCHPLWRDIYDMPQSQYGEIPRATGDDVREFLCFGYHSQLETRDYPLFYLPDQVEHFLQMAALEYPQFLDVVENKIEI